MNILIFGPPGAGKGTQARYLQVRLGLPHISSGDLFRAIRRQDSPLALRVQEYLDRGAYVPDELTIQVITARLMQADARNGFILDGFPRTIAQAVSLERMLADFGQVVDLAICINVTERVVIERLSTRLTCPRCNAVYNRNTRPPLNGRSCHRCGGLLERRSDESPAIVHRRLKTYHLETEPLLARYRAWGRLIEIDGAQPEDQVARDLALALGKIAQPRATAVAAEAC